MLNEELLEKQVGLVTAKEVSIATVEGCARYLLGGGRRKPQRLLVLSGGTGHLLMQLPCFMAIIWQILCVPRTHLGTSGNLGGQQARW